MCRRSSRNDFTSFSLSLSAFLSPIRTSCSSTESGGTGTTRTRSSLLFAAAPPAAPAAFASAPFDLDCCWLVLRPPRPFFFVRRDAWVMCGGGCCCCCCCCAGRLLETPPLGPAVAPAAARSAAESISALSTTSKRVIFSLSLSFARQGRPSSIHSFKNLRGKKNSTLRFFDSTQKLWSQSTPASHPPRGRSCSNGRPLWPRQQQRQRRHAGGGLLPQEQQRGELAALLLCRRRQSQRCCCLCPLLHLRPPLRPRVAASR